jgi:predicted dinucleotide-binding enzyme
MLYAGAAIQGKRFGISAIATATGTMDCATLILVPIAFVAEQAWTQSPSNAAIGASECDRQAALQRTMASNRPSPECAKAVREINVAAMGLSQENPHARELDMKVAIVGPGSIGKALARRLNLAGHEICLSFSRDDDRLRAIAEKLGVGFGAPADVAKWADVVALTTPWSVLDTVIAALGDLSGKIVWDNTNAVASDLSTMLVGTTTSVGEEVQKRAPRARVVKCIPTFAELLDAEDPRLNGLAVTSYVAGNDAEAKAYVCRLLADLPTIPVDVGNLTAARLIEPMMLLLVQLAYLRGMGPMISFNLVQQDSSGHV